MAHDPGSQPVTPAYSHTAGVVGESTRVTRLAPSPTGALHLGNAYAFLVNWAVARRGGWRIVLRVEDLDTPRTKAGADVQAIDDLRWLGTDWDEGPHYQADDLSAYYSALSVLSEKRLLYPCTCTRKEIKQAQSAPHGDEHELRYPGTCRPPGRVESVDMVKETEPESLTGAASDTRGTPSALRMIVPDEDVAFTDEFYGPQRVNVQQQVGDFVVATKTGLPAYQLAVVVDDARQGVTDVVRGDDLLRSTARQVWLYRALASADKVKGKLDTAEPRWWHLPLVVGPDGRRLAKRHGDTRVAWYRDQGVDAQRLIGLIARWAGATERNTPMTAEQFRDTFDITQMPMQTKVFTTEDHAWLIGS